MQRMIMKGQLISNELKIGKEVNNEKSEKRKF